MARSFPVKCPFCPTIVDSHETNATSKAELRVHIKAKHMEPQIEFRIKFTTIQNGSLELLEL